MNKLTGAAVPPPNDGLIKIADLIFDDYPYLILHRDKRGDNFLQYWCDKDDNFDRWLLLGVTDHALEEYLASKLPLRSIIASPKNDFLYALDIDFDGDIVKSIITSVAELPCSYLPSEDSVYEYEPIPVKQGKRKNLKMAIDGDWGFAEWREFPRLFKGAYSFLSNLNYKTATAEFDRYPMNDGFSAMHFFRALSSQLRPNQDMKLEGVSYASPGAINFNVDTAVSNHLITMLLELQRDEAIAHTDYKFLMSILRQEDIRGENAVKFKPSQILDDQLNNLAIKLLVSMKVPNPEHLHEISESGLMAAKIALAYYRLVSERLLEFCRAGKVSIPSLV